MVSGHSNRMLIEQIKHQRYYLWNEEDGIELFKKFNA
jgi:hypothetical protein